MDGATLKERAQATVAEWADRLLAVSHDLHAHPELAFAEQHAHSVLTAALADAGLEVEQSAFGLPTAFRAWAGAGDGPVVGLVCEYDALPEIGHACGHNVIAAAGLGAAAAGAAVVGDAGGRLVVLGAPAEEGGGGKVLMLEAGAFADLDVAMMVHPADADLTTMDVLAVAQLTATFHGRAAHAAAAPDAGRNALDAAVLAYQAVAALRQHIGRDERVHGTFTDGGGKPNVVPAHAAQHWFVRSPTDAGLAALRERVVACLNAGALAAGCTVDIEPFSVPYRAMTDNDPLIDAWTANAIARGRSPERPAPGTRVVGSTDMGDVSHAVPAIHPMIQVAPTGVPIHTADFAVHAAGPGGDAAVLDGAATLAMTAIDVWCDPALLPAAAAAHAASHSR